MSEPLCTCGHTRDMHDICHFDHNECLCGCREFRGPPPPARSRAHRGCDACPAMWDDRWVDLIVPNEAWEVISPKSEDGDSGGQLCAGCVTERLVNAGLTDVPVAAYGRPFWHRVAI